MRRSANRIERSPVMRVPALKPDTTSALTFKLFVGHDLDAEPGQSLVVVHRGCEVTDGSHAEIAQDLRTDADFTPLPVAIRLRGLFLRERRNGNTGRAVAQINQHASVGLLKMFE